MRHSARRLRSHRVSKGVRRRIRTRRSGLVAAMDCRSRTADFASAFLARGHFVATNFQISAGRIAPCAPGVRRAEDCPPYHAIAAPSKLIRVRKLLQDWVVARRPEVFEHSTKNRIQEWIRMRDVQIERHQLAIQMQLRLIIERVAVIIFQPLLQRPRDDVAQRVKVKVQIERDTIIEPDAFVIERIPADETETKRNDLAVLSPDKKQRTV